MLANMQDTFLSVDDDIIPFLSSANNNLGINVDCTLPTKIKP